MKRFTLKQIFGGLYVSYWDTVVIETMDKSKALQLSQTDAAEMLYRLENDKRFRGMYKIEAV